MKALLLIAAFTLTAAPIAQAPAFKTSGFPTAPLTIELFTDYSCPHCAALTAQTVPQLEAQFVTTGKVRLIHRDLASPGNAEKAARYANAAGQLGYFAAASHQLFKTQETWMSSGDIDKALTSVIPPGAMQKIRDLVKNDATLGESIKADVALAKSEKIARVPCMIFSSNKVHDKVEGEIAFLPLKNYVNQLLAK